MDVAGYGKESSVMWFVSEGPRGRAPRRAAACAEEAGAAPPTAAKRRGWSLPEWFCVLTWVGAQAAGALPVLAPPLSARRRLDDGHDDLPPPLDVNALCGDNMVLSRHQPRMFGRAAPGQTVTVEFPELRHEMEASADEQGSWVATLAGLPAGGPYTAHIRAPMARANITLSRVWVGEVFLFLGQSNSGFPLYALAYGDTWGRAEHVGQRRIEQEYMQGLNPDVHFYIANRHTSQVAEHEHRARLGWQPSGHYFAQIGALPYLFAVREQARLHVPVGVVQVTSGGTHAYEWLSSERIAALGGEIPRWPGAGLMFNGMVAPMAHLHVSGAIYSIGESDVMQSHLRDERMLHQLIAQVRETLGTPELPSVVIGLAGHRQPQNTPVEDAEGNNCYDAFLAREAQVKAVETSPQTAYVVTTDLGTVDDIHFPNKWEAARRGVHALRALTDQPRHPHLSPIMSSWQIDGSEVVVRFNNSADPIGVGRFSTRDGIFDALPFSEVKGLAISNDSSTWHWASASYRDGALRIFAEGMEKPVAARYNWARNPIGNLYALSFHLPVAPWRTDDIEIPRPDGHDRNCTKGTFLRPHELREKLERQQG